MIVHETTYNIFKLKIIKKSITFCRTYLSFPPKRPFYQNRTSYLYYTLHCVSYLRFPIKHLVYKHFTSFSFPFRFTYTASFATIPVLLTELKLLLLCTEPSHIIFFSSLVMHKNLKQNKIYSINNANL